MKKTIWVVTLFPEYFEPLRAAGVVGQALRGERKTEPNIEMRTINPRDYTEARYKGVDDTPYGGGPGMVMRADILAKTIKGILDLSGESDLSSLHVVYTAPRGEVWNQESCYEFSHKYKSEFTKDIVFICGRYEGVDERFLTQYVNQIISVGDYVLSGGEIAVLAILDSSLRFVKGVLGNDDSALFDSFQNGLLEFPQYTKPRVFEGLEVPEVLTNGHHEKIKLYQKQQQEIMTKKHRSDLWEKYQKGDKS